MGQLFAKLLEMLQGKNLEIVLVGLENSGKTTLLNVLSGRNSAEPMPTIGLDVKQLKIGNTTMRAWDVGGQKMYRSQWARYTQGCDVIIFVVDVSSDEAQMREARQELHKLLEDRELASTPLLIAANKIDIEPHLSEAEVITQLNLDYILENPWVCIPVSALRKLNIEKVMQWLVAQGK